MGGKISLLEACLGGWAGKRNTRTSQPADLRQGSFCPDFKRKATLIAVQATGLPGQFYVLLRDHSSSHVIDLLELFITCFWV